MCGIIGLISRKKVVYELLMGLTALQHRGQDAAGVTTLTETFNTKKGLGLVKQVFRDKHVKRLGGKMGLGHVRYTTQGSLEKRNSQPIEANYPFGIAMIHNGNVTNSEEMRKILYEEYHVLPATNNDLEYILYTLSSELNKKDLKNITFKEIFEAVKVVQSRVEGSYACIALIANHGMVAFTDPYGLRPMVMGRKETEAGPNYGFASESVAFDQLGYKTVCNVQPGEMYFIDNDFRVFQDRGIVKKQHFCVFEYIYFARPDTEIHNKLVASERVKMGKRLAQKLQRADIIPDVVIDVPSSGYFSASGLAEVLDVPYRKGLIRNEHMGRSFISPKQSEREDIVKRKLNPIRQVVDGKKVAVVDDSIVRGTTSKRIVKILREAGAKEIYFISAAPPIKHPCIYGIDMSIKTELIAANKTTEEIREFIGADALIYQSLHALEELYEGELPICTACLSGNYPTPNAEAELAKIELVRKNIKKKKNEKKKPKLMNHGV